MSILFNPTFNPASIYRPIVWVIQTIIDTTTLGPIKKAKATVTVDGAIVKIVTKSPFDSSGPVVAKIYAFQYEYIPFAHNNRLACIRCIFAVAFSVPCSTFTPNFSLLPADTPVPVLDYDYEDLAHKTDSP